MIQVKHHISNRIRLKFATALTNHQSDLLKAVFEYEHPDISFRMSKGIDGCILTATKAGQTLNSADMICWLEEYFTCNHYFGPCRPPTSSEIFQRQLVDMAAKTMFYMAIAGWILPIIPGTPFFLIAWSLGWRPDESPPDKNISHRLLN